MNSDDLKSTLQLIHKVFPLPQSDTFKGTHHITLNEKGYLEVGIWFNTEKGIRRRSIIFDEENEVITESLLLGIKPEMLKGLND